jgi:hypothetical protein
MSCTGHLQYADERDRHLLHMCVIGRLKHACLRLALNNTSTVGILLKAEPNMMSNTL